MKTYFFLLLLCVTFMTSFSQSVRLIPSNPAPRVGETFNISFDIDYPKTINFQSIIKQDSIKPIGGNGCSANNNLASGSVRLSKSFNDTGMVNFGPFTFNIDGKVYESDSISINITPALPNVKTGFWVRFLNYNGLNYLITEQRILEDKEKKTKRPSMPIHPRFMGRDDGNFAVIKDSTLLAHGLEPKVESTNSGAGFIEGEELEQNELKYSYKTMIYKITAKADYSNDFQLSKEHFENLPDDVVFNPIAIMIYKD